MAIHVAVVRRRPPRPADRRDVRRALDDTADRADLLARDARATTCATRTPATSIDARVAGDDDAPSPRVREAMPEHKAGASRRCSTIRSRRIAGSLRGPPRLGRRVPADRGADRRDPRARPRAARRATARRSTRPTLIETTTSGIRWLPELGIRRVILAPVVLQPAVQLPAGRRRLAVLRLSGQPTTPSTRTTGSAPPPAVVRLHRALGDETRLRILKLLASRDLYLTEIAQQLDLSKPTIKHHLAILRSAGLVTIVEAGTVIYYSLRRDRIDDASTELGRFLNP